MLVGPGVEVSAYLACRWRSGDAWGIKIFAMYETWWEWSVCRCNYGTEKVSARLRENTRNS